MATTVVNTSRSDLLRRFQLSGLQMRSDALTLFEAELKHGTPPYESIDDFISHLSDVFLTKMSIDSMIINCELAGKAIEVVREERRLKGSQAESASASELVVIKNVADQSREGTSGKPSASQFNHHYNQLLSALKKLPAFESGQFRLTPIDQLNTYDSSLDLKCILFALVRKDPSRILEFLLEDPTGKVPVTFAREHTNFREWATFENGIYLIEGSYNAVGDTFLVKSIGLPPAITSMLPNPESSPSRDSMVIILADIHLDNPQTIERLKFLFAGYSQVDQVPEVFVLMGDFTQSRVDHFDLKDHMKNLVKLIGTFKRLANQSRFVFVPGPNDFSLEDLTSSQREVSESFAQPHFTADHFPTTTAKLKHFYLASNPFHLQVQGRNLCLSGSPLFTHATKNVLHSPVSDYAQANRPSLVSPKNIDTFIASLGRLMISSAHLNAGLNRSFSSALSLFPQIPDTILFADASFGQFQQVALYDSSVQFASIGSFSQGDGHFACYYVDTNILEESQVST